MSSVLLSDSSAEAGVTHAEGRVVQVLQPQSVSRLARRAEALREERRTAARGESNDCASQMFQPKYRTGKMTHKFRARPAKYEHWAKKGVYSAAAKGSQGWSGRGREEPTHRQSRQ